MCRHTAGPFRSTSAPASSSRARDYRNGDCTHAWRTPSPITRRSFMRNILPWTLAVAMAAAVTPIASAQSSTPSPSQTPPPDSTTSTPSTPSTTSTPSTQSGSSQTGSSTTTTTSSTTNSASTNSSDSGWWSNNPSHWTAAGFVGSNFGGSNLGGATTNSSSVDFGGQVGYLYRGVVGGEFLADFAPRFDMNNALLTERPDVNSYMANAIVAIPMGADHQIQPYLSGGFGAIQMRSTVLSSVALSSTNV